MIRAQAPSLGAGVASPPCPPQPAAGTSCESFIATLQDSRPPHGVISPVKQKHTICTLHANAPCRVDGDALLLVAFLQCE